MVIGFIVTMALSFVGYEINNALPNYNYLFCIIWGCFMTLVNLYLNEILDFK